MAEAKDNVHKITREDLLNHREEAEHRLDRLMHRGRMRKLVDEVRKLDAQDDFLMSSQATDLVRALRDGLCLYEVICETLENRTGLSAMLVEGDARKRGEVERRLKFVVAYGCFAIGAFVENMLETVRRSITKPAPGRLGKVPEGFFDYGRDRNEALKILLSDFLDALQSKDGGGRPVVSDWEDLIQVGSDFFHAMRTQSADLVEADPELRELVSGITFEVQDVRFTGTEVADRPEQSVQAFAPVDPDQVVGNRKAKEKVLRYMDRLALFDKAAQKNPIVELGGLAWTVFWDGFPGTGKTTMMRMAMTRLSRRCRALDLPYQFVTIDPSIKDEYYGRTGKNLLERFNKVSDPGKLTLVFFDDIDLLLMPRNTANISGSDMDVLNITMQFLDGAFTIHRGNTQVYAATNEPLGTESALRQRFHDRVEVKGPETWKDFADLFHIKLRNLMAQDLVRIETGRNYRPPLAGQEGRTPSRRPAGKGAAKGSSATWEDIARVAEGLHKENERFTGRPIHSVSEALMERCADFEIPEEFFDPTGEFQTHTYSRRVETLKSLYKPITPEMVLEEMERYAQAEQRYESGRAKSMRERILAEMIARYDAEKMFQNRIAD